MEQAVYVKEAFDLFDKVNNHLLKQYYSFLNHTLTPKQLLVLDLVHKGEPIKVHNIAEQLGFSVSSTSQLVSKLENESYVVRSINPENRREIFLTIGEKGKEYYNDFDKVNQFLIDNFFSKMSVEETKQLRDIADKLHTIVTSENVIHE